MRIFSGVLRREKLPAECFQAIAEPAFDAVPDDVEEPRLTARGAKLARYVMSRRQPGHERADVDDGHLGEVGK